MEKLLLELSEYFLRQVSPMVLRFVQQRSGGEVIGRVAGRAVTEDEEIELDRACDKLFKQTLRRFRRSHGVKIHAYSEHGIYGTSLAESQFLCAIDPFDGSGLFRRGLPAEWWSVLTIFNLEGKPIVGGAVDILREELDGHDLVLGNV